MNLLSNVTTLSRFRSLGEAAVVMMNGERPRMTDLPPHAAPAPESPRTDWDLLFCAVRERLVATVDGIVEEPATLTRAEQAACVRAAVLDCVAALEQLHGCAPHAAGHRTFTVV